MARKYNGSGTIRGKLAAQKVEQAQCGVKLNVVFRAADQGCIQENLPLKRNINGCSATIKHSIIFNASLETEAAINVSHRELELLKLGFIQIKAVNR